MLNALERASIAKYVADYLIDRLLIEEPMRSDELQNLARDVTDDKISDPADLAKVADLAFSMVSKDPRVVLKPRGETTLWIYHREFSQITEG